MAQQRIYDGVWDLVGQTPLVRLRRLPDPSGAEVCAKLESKNPSGSVKDRPAHAMLLAAERAGSVASGATIVEATSGNTGISLAMLSAVRGYRCVIVMPEDMSSARQAILRAYGAEVILTPAHHGMRGAVEEAERIVDRTPGAFMPRQFENPDNPRAHAETTAEEIWSATRGELSCVVIGVGTGGTLTGIARALKARKPALRVYAVEPRASAVLSGGKPGLHGIQGLGAGFVPKILDRSLIDEVVTVSDPEAERMTTRLAREEGLLVGPSSGANVHAAVKVAREMLPTERVVTILCDTGERYHA
ncbi:MAG TPA: cysteine synthase A [Polyangiales bacterium]